MGIANELLTAIEQMKEGKEEGFAVVYSQTYNYVYSKAKYLMKSEEDALDLTQETYVQAYKGISGIDNPENIYAWLGGIVYRQGMKIFNKKKELLVEQEQDYIFEDVASNEATPEENAEQNATRQVVRGIIEELPELQRMAVMAFYFDNMKIDAIAQMCDCSSNTIKSRLNYAKKYLKEKVVEHEKKNNYKLYSVTPAVLYLVFKDMFGSADYKMPHYAVQEVYGSACGKLKIQPKSIAGNKAVVSKAATKAATKVGVSTFGTKAAMIATAVIVTVGAGAAIVHTLNKDKEVPPNTNVVETEREIDEPDSAEASSSKTIEKVSEVVYNENIPMEGKYVFGDYMASITNARVTDDRNALYDLELVFEGNGDRKGEKITVNDANEVDGVTQVEAVSDAGNRWFGSLRHMEDGSMIMNMSVEDAEFGVYDLSGENLAILTKAAADKIAITESPEEGKYVFSPGEGAEYTVTVSDISNVGDETSLNMSFDYVAGGGNKIEGIMPDESLRSVDGIYTFSGTTGWEAIMWGYMYFTEDGQVYISYTCDNWEPVFWGGFGNGTYKPLVLEKN
ncbi:MAG: sigma-70 family RNA polymerase sigma factor [Pararoseburia sp.]|nr:sigma-70 family RNA polymerase sigma factor [Lachnospiraceae bacterium]MDY4794076.1 sigma-70 family RNA polymerase sigma factor [Pararoseburia sp.]